MASGQQKFPPQTQPSQPGKEHAMQPTPASFHTEYKGSNKLKGKVALVTGGDSGIGRSVCHCFALEGAAVAFTYVNGMEDKDAQDTMRMLREANTEMEHLALATDLGFEENCRIVVEEVVNKFGRIDILVNNAAQQYEKSTIEDIGEDQLVKVFRTNIFHQFFMTKFAVKHMSEGGSIINTTSVTAYKGHTKLLDYSSTKGAIVAFTRSLSLQLVQRGIRVNAVAPGPVWTPLIPSSFSEEEVATFGSDVPMNRAAQPSEIAPTYVFLASPECSSYYTGQVFHPNGGTIVNG